MLFIVTNHADSKIVGFARDMHLVIFLARKYKTEYRTSTNLTDIVGKAAWYDAL